MQTPSKQINSDTKKYFNNEDVSSLQKLSTKKEESARPAPVEHQQIDPQPGHVPGDQDQGDEGHAGRR